MSEKTNTTVLDLTLAKIERGQVLKVQEDEDNLSTGVVIECDRESFTMVTQTLNISGNIPPIIKERTYKIFDLKPGTVHEVINPVIRAEWRDYFKKSTQHMAAEAEDKARRLRQIAGLTAVVVNFT